MNRRPRTYRCDTTELARLREAKGLSEQELAARAGVTAKSLRRILRGGEAFLTTIARLARVLGVAADAFLAERLPAPAAVRPTHFRLSIRIEGQFDVARHNDRLIRLTPELVASLQQQGVVITSQASKLAISGLSAGGEWRLLVLILARTDDRASWFILAVKPGMFAKIARATVIDASSSEFGEVVSSGWGDTAPSSAVTNAAELFGRTGRVMLILGAR